MSRDYLTQAQTRRDKEDPLITALFKANSNLIYPGTQTPVDTHTHTQRENGVSVPTVGHKAMTVCVSDRHPVPRDKAAVG